MSEQEVPSSAKVVVIGAGIVGNCLVGHLARLGWTDMVLLDKGPLPNPGGSTGHASNFIFPVDHNKEMALLGVQSANQYRDVERSVDCGGIEVARTQERMDEFQRRMTSAKAWGVEADLLTPAGVKELVPFINDEVILGGFHCPTRQRRRLARHGHAVPQRGHRNGRAAGVRQHRSARRRDRGRAGHRAPEGHRGRDRQGSHRGRVRRDRMWRLVEPHREHGRRDDPARPGRSPDGRRRADRRARRDAERDQLPDRAGHGHVLLRASVVGLDGGGLRTPTVRSCTTPTRSPPTRRRR